MAVMVKERISLDDQGHLFDLIVKVIWQFKFLFPGHPQLICKSNLVVGASENRILQIFIPL